MSRKKLFPKLTVISLAVAFILASCNTSPAPAISGAPSTATPTQTQDVPTATFTPVPSLTGTATPLPTATPTLTVTQPPTPTAELTPQVNPGMNAYCRRGPGTSYYAITYLQAGTNYNVLGQNGLNTWWLIQLSGKITCWMGDPTSVLLGPIWDVPIVSFPPLPRQPTGFTGTIACHSAIQVINVALTWKQQTDAAGYHLYLNGDLVTTLGPQVVAYKGDSALFDVGLNYTLEAYNDFGVSIPASINFKACGS